MVEMYLPRAVRWMIWGGLLAGWAGLILLFSFRRELYHPLMLFGWLCFQMILTPFARGPKKGENRFARFAKRRIGVRAGRVMKIAGVSIMLFGLLAIFVIGLVCPPKSSMYPLAMGLIVLGILTASLGISACGELHRPMFGEADAPAEQPGEEPCGDRP